MGSTTFARGLRLVSEGGVKLTTKFDGTGLQLWGGVECTINRVGDAYFEQLNRTGHPNRLSDFEQFAALGIKALRHPVLWERCAPCGVGNADWEWADASLACIKKLGIRPIVGLMHHGSGPRNTNLLDPTYPQQLSEYAAAVAHRYPWVQDYTPVNEPLTTARFSALYGHWYPHKRDDHSFCRALLNQCRAVVCSMRAIREVNPSARLVQTDDLGKVFSSPKLKYQAEFENERRWCTFDLLCGKIDRSHPMWSYFKWAGVDESELDWFLDNPFPPAVIGINHYLSGERYLDENVHRYPEDTHGGNGRDSFADVLAVRVLQEGVTGPHALLTEGWNRFHLPIAVTECHNGCTREEQLRWFLEVWRGAERSRQDGADILAVTAWSLLGAFDWNQLVTRADGHYEPGVYDVRSEPPRPTAMAEMVRSLAAGHTPEHSILEVPGWWKRPQRFIYGFSVLPNGESLPEICFDDQKSPLGARPLLIVGRSKSLGQAFARICGNRGIPCRLFSGEQLDIAERKSVHKILFNICPWAIVHVQEYWQIDGSVLDKKRCYRDNTEVPAFLAAECSQRNIQLLTFSSDQVFSREKTGPNFESDAVNPVDYNGICKADGERLVLAAMPSALVVRSGPLFGPYYEDNVVTLALRRTGFRGDPIDASDTIVSPTYIPDLVNIALDLLIDGERGIWHLANRGEASLSSFTEELVATNGAPPAKCASTSHNLQTPSPANRALSSERASLLPSLQNALSRFKKECRATRGNGSDLFPPQALGVVLPA